MLHSLLSLVGGNFYQKAIGKTHVKEYMIDFKELAKAGVHFGHQTSRWNPRMAPYIWGSKNGIHLIDISKTAFALEHAAQFLQQMAAEGKQILWVGTKKSAQGAIEQAGVTTAMPFVTHRWIGGTLTNNSQVKKSITRLLHLEDVIKKSAQFPYSKKELVMVHKAAERLGNNVGGIRSLRWPVGAVVLVDVRKESTALKEAVSKGIPVVALVDTNCDPSAVNHVIPGNDDSPKSIALVLSYLAAAAHKGAQVAQKERKEQVEQAADNRSEIMAEAERKLARFDNEAGRKPSRSRK